MCSWDFTSQLFLKEIPLKGMGFTFLYGDFVCVSPLSPNLDLVPDNFLISKYCGLGVA